MFDLEKVLIQENFDNSRPLIDNDILESSYFDMTLDYIKESKNEIGEYTKQFYLTICESNNIEIVNEAFIDFFSKVKEIIKRFLKFIQRLFDKFIVNLNGIVKSDKFITNNKKRFMEFTNSHEFNFNGYTYTFNSTIPVINAIDIFDDGLNKIGSKTNDIEKFKLELDTLYTNLVDYIQNNFFDTFRGVVIGKENTINSSDFANELFSVYRNDNSDKEDITVSKSVIDDCLLNFQSFSKYEKDTKNTRKKIESDYKIIEDKLNKFSRRIKDSDYESFIKEFINPNYTSDATSPIKIDSDMVNKIELIAKAKANQVIEMSNIHGLAFAAKLDAIKERYIQDKTILYKALYKIKGSIKEEVENIDDANLDQFSDKLIVGNGDPEEDDIYFDNGLSDISLESMNLNYQYTMIEQAMNQCVTECYVKTLALKASGNMTLIESMILQESVSDNIKLGIKKITNAIVTIWNKFLEALNTLLKNEEEYLKKYQSIILKKKVKLDGITMFNYFEGIPQMLNFPVIRPLDLNNKDLDDIDVFKKKVFIKWDDKTEFRVSLINYFKGGNSEVQFNDDVINRNMKNMYDYCINYKDTGKQIQKDLDNVNTSSNKAIMTIETEAKKSNTVNNESANIQDYSFLLELNIGSKKNDTTNNSVSNNNNETGKGAYTKSSIDKSNPNQPDVEAQIKDNSDKLEIYKNRTSNYLKVCGDVITAKQSASQAAFKDYIAIMKAHVRMYTSNEEKIDKSNNQLAQPSSSPQQQQQDNIKANRL